MFINWTFLLLFLSFFFFLSFLMTFYLNSFFMIEYLLTSILSLEYKLYFLFDWMSCIFTCIVLFISGMVMWFSHEYMFYEKHKISFCWMVLSFVMSMIMLILMPNLFTLILGWDGLGLTSYCLVVFYQSVNSYNSGMITIISNRVGDVMVIMMMIFAINFNTFNILSINYLELTWGIFIVIAGLTKSAQIPFSAWLPAAMAAPTPVSSLVHSSTLVTAGVYLLIRFDFLFQVEIMGMILLKISLLTMVMSGINAFFENDLKKIIAFSTLSQLSMMMMILALNMPDMAFFHLIMHAIFKSMLFLCAGFMIHNFLGNQDIRTMSNFFFFSPSISSCMLISSCSLMGFPFIGGFYSKDLILEYFLVNSLNLIQFSLLMIGILFTFLYNFRMIYYLLLKKSLNITLIKSSYDYFMKYPIFILTITLILTGNMFMWMLLPNLKIIFLIYFQKLTSLLAIFTSLMIFLLVKKLLNSVSNLNFFMKMWFLSDLTSYLFLWNFKFLLKTSLSDWTWVEMMGPLGLKSLTKNKFKMLFLSNYKSVPLVLMLMFLTILLLI
uniref:NADH-ubiquinone oxidoreductase chain 5 n=1 Tax=Rhipicentor nuttalli TaxID=72856 RepID=A0A3G2JZW6_9ACAR|nr:NADH dehydrogenase subunit 5 [Rhipicentor nuttalli]AYN50580.1 NADH dehydrogenase subunit 5 [Rhipicentor nuttalli]